MAVALASRFWRLGRPKIYHEVATHLKLAYYGKNIGDYVSLDELYKALDEFSSAERNSHITKNVTTV